MRDLTHISRRLTPPTRRYHLYRDNNYFGTKLGLSMKVSPYERATETNQAGTQQKRRSQ